MAVVAGEGEGEGEVSVTACPPRAAKVMPASSALVVDVGVLLLLLGPAVAAEAAGEEGGLMDSDSDSGATSGTGWRMCAAGGRSVVEVGVGAGWDCARMEGVGC